MMFCRSVIVVLTDSKFITLQQGAEYATYILLLIVSGRLSVWVGT
jgi:hypothetical protein